MPVIWQCRKGWGWGAEVSVTARGLVRSLERQCGEREEALGSESKEEASGWEGKRLWPEVRGNSESSNILCPRL